MKLLPRAQMVSVAGGLVALILLLSMTVRPLVGSILHQARSIASVYKGGDEVLLTTLRRRGNALEKAAADAVRLAATEHSEAHWYDHLQSTLRASGITAERISSKGMRYSDGFEVEPFTFSAATRYHLFGAFVDQLESGPYVCALTDIHLVAPSLLDGDLQVEATVQFLRKPR